MIVVGMCVWGGEKGGSRWVKWGNVCKMCGVCVRLASWRELEKAGAGGEAGKCGEGG